MWNVPKRQQPNHRADNSQKIYQLENEINDF